MSGSRDRRKAAEILRLAHEGLTQSVISERVGVTPRTVRGTLSRAGEQPQTRRVHNVALFEVPDGLDDESRRVVAYVNGEIERWNACQRTEPIDLILDAARERLTRAGPDTRPL